MKNKWAVLATICILILVSGSVTAQPLSPAEEIKSRVNWVVCQLISIIWAVVAALAALVIVLAGMKMLTSESPEDRNEAKNRVIHAVIGLFIVLIAIPLVNYLLPVDFTPFECDTIWYYPPGGGIPPGGQMEDCPNGPKVKIIPDKLSVKPGETVKFNCTAEALGGRNVETLSIYFEKLNTAPWSGLTFLFPAPRVFYDQFDRTYSTGVYTPACLFIDSGGNECWATQIIEVYDPSSPFAVIDYIQGKNRVDIIENNEVEQSSDGTIELRGNVVGGTKPYTFRWHYQGGDDLGTTTGEYTTKINPHIPEGSHTVCLNATDSGSIVSNDNCLGINVTKYNHPPRIDEIVVLPPPDEPVDNKHVRLSYKATDIDGDSIAECNWTAVSRLSGERKEFSGCVGVSFIPKTDGIRTPGDWDITLVVTDDRIPNPKSSAPKTITINVKPTEEIRASYTVTPPCGDASAGKMITFDGSESGNPYKDIVDLEYHWDFGDGFEADGASVMHRFAEQGEYYIKLTVKIDKARVDLEDEFINPCNITPEEWCDLGEDAHGEFDVTYGATSKTVEVCQPKYHHYKLKFKIVGGFPYNEDTIITVHRCYGTPMSWDINISKGSEFGEDIIGILKGCIMISSGDIISTSTSITPDSMNPDPFTLYFGGACMCTERRPGCDACCPDNEYCKAHMCEDRIPIGSLCDTDVEGLDNVTCITGVCEGGTCGGCMSTSDCGAGVFCNKSHLCQPTLGYQGDCEGKEIEGYDNLACTSGHCWAGFGCVDCMNSDQCPPVGMWEYYCSNESGFQGECRQCKASGSPCEDTLEMTGNANRTCNSGLCLSGTCTECAHSMEESYWEEWEVSCEELLPPSSEDWAYCNATGRCELRKDPGEPCSEAMEIDGDKDWVCKSNSCNPVVYTCDDV